MSAGPEPWPGPRGAVARADPRCRGPWPDRPLDISPPLRRLCCGAHAALWPCSHGDAALRYGYAHKGTAALTQALLRRSDGAPAALMLRRCCGAHTGPVAALTRRRCGAVIGTAAVHTGGAAALTRRCHCAHCAYHTAQLKRSHAAFAALTGRCCVAHTALLRRVHDSAAALTQARLRYAHTVLLLCLQGAHAALTQAQLRRSQGAALALAHVGAHTALSRHCTALLRC